MHHTLELRQIPCKFDKVWLSTSKVINGISVKFDSVFLKVIHLDGNSYVNSQPFIMRFCKHHRLVLGNFPVNLAKFDKVLQKLFMSLV